MFEKIIKVTVDRLTDFYNFNGRTYTYYVIVCTFVNLQHPLAFINDYFEEDRDNFKDDFKNSV